MAVQIANVLAREYEVFFLFNHLNIGSTLDSSVNAVQVPVKTVIGPLACIRNLRPGDIMSLRAVIRRIRPSLSIIAQPAIDFCIKGTIASASLGIRTVSYIPMCFPAARLKGQVVGACADLLFKLYYRLFDSIITISEAQREHLIPAVGARKRVDILENLVDIAPLPATYCGSRRVRDGRLVIGVVGRISFHQKRHDRLVGLAEVLQARRRDFCFVIIGDGPDRGCLEQMVQARNLGAFFDFKGWVTSREDIYRSVDLVLMVSDYEGVPLAMLEALCMRKMVIGFLTWGTAVYGEYLDDRYLARDLNELADKLMNAEVLMDAFEAEADSIKNNVISRHGLASFRENVLTLARRLLER